ncbi:hypothetical protein OIU76_021795 [Salix suchowensis]|uniref:Uncharacterized protein n=2 Tax=Salix TaxID=40685 RepID=A0AAD6JW46_9ROSI|nr:hypothetical protein OIU76_021795 [Salix suchowensis]KAJ6411405.1 hypothetical protein OIU84_008050 [Salix udensis]
MSHISNLRLLFSPLLPTLRSPFSSKRRPFSLLTIISSSSPHPKRRHRTTPNHLSLNFRSRSKTTSRETRGRDRDEGKSMDESDTEGKRREEESFAGLRFWTALENCKELCICYAFIVDFKGKQ